MPWATIWNHPENADLKSLRQDPNVLATGDIVFIPEIQVAEFPKPTDATHKFVLNVAPAKLRLQVLDRSHKPRPNIPYTLVIDGKKKTTGTTDGEGYVVASMPGNAQKAELTVTEDGKPEKYALKLGHTDPVTEQSGVEQRLKNLGFDVSSPSAVTQSLSAFQRKFNLPVTGQADDATRDKLKSVHGC